MIQDIYHHKMEVVYDGEAVLGENDYIIAFQGRNVYMKKQKDETSGAFLTCEDILPVEYRKEAMEKYRRDAIYLLCLDGRRLFLLPPLGHPPPPPAASPRPRRPACGR